MALIPTKRALSGSTNGKKILVTATSTPGTQIHQAVTGTANFDEIWIYACNTSATAVELSIEWGGVSSPSDISIISVPAKSGEYLIIPGDILQNSLDVKAFAGTGSVVNITGFVNRITA